MNIIKYEKAKFERNHLIIDENISKNEWLNLGQALKQVEGSVQFWIGDWARFGDKRGYYTDSKVYDELEEITGYGHQTIKDFKSVSENVQSSLRNDDLSFNHHKEVAKLIPEKQEIYLKRAKEENLSVRELRSEIRKDELKIKQNIEFPKGKYRIIYADPPWKYDDRRDGRTTGVIDHYPTLSIEELCNLPISEITENNAVLFIWVTSPLLEDVFKVINAWGFEYKTSFIWDKIKHNMGHYNSVRHELLLICTRGSCTPDNIKLFDSVQSIEKTEHSKKPEFFREIIETLYTHGNKIELFARKKIDSWEIFSNEL